MVIKRDILSGIMSHIDKKEISLIIGPRQAGKTTIMKMVAERLSQRANKTLFMNLDFERDFVHFTSQQSFIQKLRLECGNNPAIIFIDEIQRKENAGLFLKALYDMDLPYKFIVSGSGSLELKEKIHESLAGRKKVFELSSISVHEFFNFKTNYQYHNKLKEYCSLHAAEVEALLFEYMNYGGYPRVVLADLEKDKTDVIHDIYTSYIEKDIAYLLKVEKISAFKNLIRILAAQAGRIVNISELSSTLGISIQTVQNYLDYAGKTFIVSLVSPFYRNVRKELTKAKIVYFNDVGLMNFVNGRFGRLSRTDAGFIFQNVIFLLLKEKYKNSNAEIHYWRTKDKAEVDFVVDMGMELLPIEVKFSSVHNDTVGRSLHNFIARYSPKESYIVNLSGYAETIVRTTKVRWIPWWELM